METLPTSSSPPLSPSSVDSEDDGSRLIAERSRLRRLLDDLRLEYEDLQSQLENEVANRQRDEVDAEKDVISPIKANASDPLPDFALLNIKFTSTECTLLSALEGKHIRQHRLRGLAGMIRFSIQFTESDCIIQSLDIQCSAIELRDFITQAQETKNLLAFFRVISRYSQVSTQRLSLFKAMQAQYSDLVQVNETTLHFRDERAQLLFAWKFTVSNTGRLEPIVRLYPIVSDEWAEVTNSLPKEFADLVQLRGLQRALEIMVDVMFGL